MSRPEYIVRFTLVQRVQHIVLMIALVLLSITGLTLKFHELWLSQFLIRLEGGIEGRGLIHRGAAILLILLTFYHLLYVMFTRAGHEEFIKLLPRRKDFNDFWKAVRYNLGYGKGYPAFEKYNFVQKFQYAGVIIGSAIMIATGLVLWFENQSMAVIPKWLMDVTAVVHGYEGLLAFLVLLLWHLYLAHLNPDVFPMDRVWLTGRMSLDDLKRKHVLEYEKVAGSTLTREGNK
jgi:cytochrome b subunit of formate dehydrogenase